MIPADLATGLDDTGRGGVCEQSVPHLGLAAGSPGSSAPVRGDPLMDPARHRHPWLGYEDGGYQDHVSNHHYILDSILQHVIDVRPELTACALHASLVVLATQK